VLVGVPIADFTGAMLLAQAVLLGLLARHQTGRGQRIDVSMLAGLAYSLTTRLASYWATGVEPRRNGSAHSVTAPYESYATADGSVVAGAWAPDAWPRFCLAIERSDLVDDPRFATNPDRVANRDALNELLRPLFTTKTTVEWEERFHRASALFGPIATVAEILGHPQMAGRVQMVDHPDLGPIPQMGPPISLSETPAAVVGPAPILGQHTAAVLADAGFSADEVEGLLARGVVAGPPVSESR
jgi:crotonobetainyl-CoA:carnitine CoA-transferase CaiB-like acyl-CoA transferase